MDSKIMFIGIDVDSKNFHFAGICQQSGEIIEGKCRPNAKALSEKFDALKKQGWNIQSCYEATYIGFSLFRQMDKLGYKCTPIASSLIPKIAGDRVKTDRKDSLKLAEFFMKGLLQQIHIPSEEDERARDLLRAYQFMKLQGKRQKQQIISSCYRLGLDFRQETGMREYWSRAHRRWLDSVVHRAEPIVQTHFKLLLRALHQIEEMLQIYESEIELLAQKECYIKSHEALVCYRGVNTISAMKIILEIGDVRRFTHPTKLVSFIGLDISEYSSGGVERKRGITKLGNKILRTAIIEACQSAKRRPQVHAVLKRRRKNIPVEYIDIADRCMNRLYKKAQGLLMREKAVNKVKVACAREMVGFIWESLMKVTNNTATKRESVDWVAKEVIAR